MSEPTLGDVARHPRRTLAILTLGALAYALAQTMIVPALPAIQHRFDASPAAATWLLTGFLIMSSVSTPLMGRLGDMYGKEKVLLASLMLFAVGSLIAALSTSLEVMILGRVVQGVGGAVFPLSFGIIRDEFPPERVATSIGLISATFGIGGGAGLVLAGVLVDVGGVAWIFWLALAATAIAAVATWRFVPESPVRAPARIDWLGAVLMSLALLVLLLGISRGNVWGWTSPQELGMLALAVVLFLGLVRWELHVPEPLVDMRLMAVRAVASTNLTAFLVGFAMFGSYILIPQLAQIPTASGFGFGATVTESGVFLLPSAVVMLFAGPLSGQLGHRFGSRLPLALGTAATSSAYFFLAVAHSQRWELYVGGALLGIGIGLAFAAMANLVVSAVRQDQTGVATAINTIMRSIGGALGAQIAGAIVAAHTVLGGRYPAEQGFTRAFTMSAIGALCALAATLTIPIPLRAAQRRRDRAAAAAGS